jgi:hypothetical protein
MQETSRKKAAVICIFLGLLFNSENGGGIFPEMLEFLESL